MQVCVWFVEQQRVNAWCNRQRENAQPLKKAASFNHQISVLEPGVTSKAVTLMGALDDGLSVAVTPDGPRGPRYSMTDSVVWLAAKSQRPIVPVSLNSRWHWELNGWDRMQIPKPFSPAELVMGEPLRVPTDLARGDRHRWAATVRDRLMAITDWDKEHTEPAAAERG